MPVPRRRVSEAAATKASQISGSGSGVPESMAIFPLGSYGYADS